jgi:acylphosphatase
VFRFPAGGLEPAPIVSHAAGGVMASLHLQIEGRVQGVGFRWYVVREARALGLEGRVRNRPDGAVELDAAGPEDALRGLIDAVREGPPAARVQRVTETWGVRLGPLRGFEIVD